MGIGFLSEQNNWAAVDRKLHTYIELRAYALLMQINIGTQLCINALSKLRLYSIKVALISFYS